jgi:hypothetical protein
MSIAGNAFGDGATTHFDGNLMISGSLIQAGARASSRPRGPITRPPAQIQRPHLAAPGGAADRADAERSGDGRRDSWRGCGHGRVVHDSQR